MAYGIGPTLRDARGRRDLSLEEVETATKIRLRYLRAMENEEWDVLPGGAYSRAFLRTYAAHLGLDGERLAEDYKQAVEDGGGERRAVAEAQALGVRRNRQRRPSTLLVWLLAAAALIAVLVGVALVGGGGSGPKETRAGKGGKHGGAAGGRQEAAAGAAAKVALQLVASGEVWVCLLDASGEPVIDGAIMEAGEEQGPFKSKGFAVAFGNGEVSMLVNGEEAELPPSSSPVGYEIDQSGRLTPLKEGERPECA
jgi:cytoskeleton protein RodZ